MTYADLPIELRTNILTRWQHHARREYVMRSSEKLLRAFKNRECVALSPHPASTAAIPGCDGRRSFLVMVGPAVPSVGAAGQFAVSTSGRDADVRTSVMRLTSVAGGLHETVNISTEPAKHSLCWSNPPGTDTSGPFIFRVKVL